MLELNDRVGEEQGLDSPPRALLYSPRILDSYWLLEIRVSSSAEGGVDDNGRAFLMGLLSGLNEIM